jgi:hypothetical protein
LNQGDYSRLNRIQLERCPALPISRQKPPAFRSLALSEDEDEDGKAIFQDCR